MERLTQISGKKTKLVAGLMSGTSADGVDAGIFEITGNGTETRIRQLAFSTFAYPRGYRAFLLKNSSASSARLDDITRLNLLIAEFFADAVKKVIRMGKKRPDDIDLIGSHGQTVQHLPEVRRTFGRNIRATMQLGNPSVIAKLTGIVTVGDFRTGDIAVGGSGAPLVPYFDYLLYRSTSKHRAVLNIGGIANMTVLPRRCSLDDVTASDTGPGNMVIDELMLRLFNRQYDTAGNIAGKGTLLPPLLRRMMAHRYLGVTPPKSTGREAFGELFVRDMLRHSARMRSRDIITTATEFTALSIYMHYLRFVQKKTRIDELLVSGGGIHNEYLMDALRRYFSGVDIVPADISSIDPDAKEAACFAVLANETISGHTSNVPGATGAERKTVLGVICLP